jgi:nitroreductase
LLYFNILCYQAMLCLRWSSTKRHLAIGMGAPPSLPWWHRAPFDASKMGGNWSGLEGCDRSGTEPKRIKEVFRMGFFFSDFNRILMGFQCDFNGISGF